MTMHRTLRSRVRIVKGDGQPSASQVHINRPLTNMSIAWMQDHPLISRMAFPEVMVQKRSDQYWKYSLDDFNRIDVEERSEGSVSAGSGYRLDTDDYRTIKYALHHDIDDDRRANSDSPLRPDQDATMFLTQQMMLFEERAWARRYFQTGVWGTNLTGGGTGATGFSQWSDSGSDPIQTVHHWMTEMLRLTGREPNCMVLGYETWQRGLQDHPAILDRIKHTQTAEVTPGLVARLFGIERLLISRHMYVNAQEENTFDGSDATAKQFILGKHALLCHAPAQVGLYTPTAGATFVWQPVAGSSGPVMKQFRIEELESDRMEIQMAFDHKVVAPDLGIFFGDAVA